ncbi:ATP-binding cassette domain-containing protein [Streptomyces scopuliridis]|uniref:ATP-binding cassette domain-containing protein n=1 Tax=Streptomyces scopuliridis TaxID=452529 RepID=UPI0036ABAA55
MKTLTDVTDVIVVAGARKRYGEKRALNGFDLTVERGTVHGVLGPNGAGKTTAVRILTTLLRPDEGLVRVAGLDVRTHAREVRRRIGLLGQHAALDEDLSGRQNLEMFGRLYHLVWPIGFLSNAIATPESMPGWLGAVVWWNPMSATATAVRDLFGTPGGGAGAAAGSWAAEHAGTLAVLWPVALLALFFPLAVRRFGRLSR